LAAQHAKIGRTPLGNAGQALDAFLDPVRSELAVAHVTHLRFPVAKHGKAGS
jgi:hypothetical protein